MLIPLFAMMALIVPQDARIADLFKLLEDDSVEVRDRAQRELTDLGEAAVPDIQRALGAAGLSAEVKERAAAAVRDIALAAKAREVYRDPQLHTIRAEGVELGKILDDLRTAGVRMDSSAIDKKALVSIDARDLPLMEVLDRLCAGSDARTWEWKDDGSIAFSRDRHPVRPASYAGPFRIRLKSLQLTRSTDFQNRTLTLEATLETDWERGLKPLRAADLEVAKAVDDRGTVLDVRRGPDNGRLQALGGGRVIVQANAWAGMPGSIPPVFTLAGLDPQASRVSFQGTARFMFPLEIRDFALDLSSGNDSKDMGDTQVQARRIGNTGHFVLTFKASKGAPPAGWAETVGERLDAESLAATDTDGAELKGTLFPMHATFAPGQAGEPTVSFQYMVQKAGTKAIKSLKFRFADRTFVKSVPFRFSDVPLP